MLTVQWQTFYVQRNLNVYTVHQYTFCFVCLFNDEKKNENENDQPTNNDDFEKKSMARFQRSLSLSLAMFYSRRRFSNTEHSQRSRTYSIFVFPFFSPKCIKKKFFDNFFVKATIDDRKGNVPSAFVLFVLFLFLCILDVIVNEVDHSAHEKSSIILF